MAKKTKPIDPTETIPAPMVAPQAEATIPPTPAPDAPEAAATVPLTPAPEVGQADTAPPDTNVELLRLPAGADTVLPPLDPEKPLEVRTHPGMATEMTPIEVVADGVTRTYKLGGDPAKNMNLPRMIYAELPNPVPVAGYCQREFRLEPRDAAALNGLWGGLKKIGARLQDGREISKPELALVWFLENYARASE